MRSRLNVQLVVRIGLSVLAAALHAHADTGSRPQPPGLEAGPAYHPPGLAYGAAFKDRILPIPIHEGLEEDGIWGADGVVPRDIHNGLEDPKWSHWGGKVLQGPDRRYHMITCRWPSDDPRGHGAWPESEIVYAVSAKPTGPFVYHSTVGKGHNPEIIRLRIQAEEDLDPQTDLDLKSLRLGAFQEVNYGRGAKARSSKADGRGLIVEFDAQGHGLMADNIAAKLLGQTKDNRLIIGYAVLPGQKQL